MRGTRAIGLAALALGAALTWPGSGRAWHWGHDDGSGAPNYDPPLYYPRTTYIVPLLHRCVGNHRPATVSVYPANNYPEIEGSYLVIKSSAIPPLPWRNYAQGETGCRLARDGQPEAAVEEVMPAGPPQK
jgi:hypothetical protein